MLSGRAVPDWANPLAVISVRVARVEPAVLAKITSYLSTDNMDCVPGHVELHDAFNCYDGYDSEGGEWYPSALGKSQMAGAIRGMESWPYESDVRDAEAYKAYYRGRGDEHEYQN